MLLISILGTVIFLQVKITKKTTYNRIFRPTRTSPMSAKHSTRSHHHAAHKKYFDEAWQKGIDEADGDPRWDAYDCDIMIATNEYNSNLKGKASFHPLDWKIVKAMIWLETGPRNRFWGSNVMQIGMYTDPGLNALLSGKEGGELILKPGQTLKFQKGGIRKDIVGWKPFSIQSIARHYSGSGDRLYAKKLEYTFSAVSKRKAIACP